MSKPQFKRPIIAIVAVLVIALVLEFINSSQSTQQPAANSQTTTITQQ